MAKARPSITSSLTLSDFTGWYWLKTELIALCRILGLGTTGSKLELENNLLGHFSGKTGKTGKALKAAPKRRTVGQMPATFAPQTIIGKGWRCNPALGAYFREVIGSSFHFNAAMRDFIHNSSGRTLADAAVCYRASVHPSAPTSSIPKQLEYNQHFRDFFTAHPGATRQQAISAWWEKRSRYHGTRRGLD